MGSSGPKDSKGGKWKPLLRFYIGEGKWEALESDQIVPYFLFDLLAHQETIIFSEIRKYNLGWSITGLMGHWHEYTLVETTNWYWSFEKNSEGIYVQRSKDRDNVRCYFGGEKRKPDKPEGRSSKVAFEENIIDVVEWIIRRGELNATYDVFKSNCHFFASVLYEAITRTKGNRRLSNTV